MSELVWFCGLEAVNMLSLALFAHLTWHLQSLPLTLLLECIQSNGFSSRIVVNDFVKLLVVHMI